MGKRESGPNSVDYLSTNQVSKMLGVGLNDVNALIRSNHFLNAVKIGGRWRIPANEYDSYKNSLKDTTNCLTVKESIERLGYKAGNEASVLELIKRSKLPNAFKQNAQWWIPENDIKHIVKMKLESLSAEEVSQRLKVTSSNYITSLINKNLFPNAFKIDNKWRIPLKDIEKYEEMLEAIELKEAMKILGVHSKENVLNLLKKNTFPNAFKLNNNWRIPVGDIVNFLSKVKNCLGTMQVAERLGYKSEFPVYQLIKESILPDAFKENGQWWIPISNVEALEKEQSLFLGTTQVARRLDISSAQVIGLIHKNKFPIAFKENLGKWSIPIKDVEKFEESYNTNDSIDLDEASKRLGYQSHTKMKSLLKNNTFPNAYKFKGKIWIPLTDFGEVQEILQNRKEEKYRKLKLPFNNLEEQEKTLNTLGLNEAAQMLGFQSKQAVSYQLKKNRFPNAFKFNNSWRIPISDIDNFLSKVKDCLNTTQVTERLGYKAEFSVHQLIKKSILPDAFKANGQWWIPISNIEVIEKQHSQSIDTTQVAKRLNLNSSATVTELIHKEKIPNAFKDVFGKWRIPLKDIEEYEESLNTDNAIDLEEATKRLGYRSLTKVRSLLENNYFPNAYKSTRKTWIPLKDFEKIQGDFQKREKPKKEKVEKIVRKPAEVTISTLGFLNSVEIERKLKVGRDAILQRLQKGAFTKAFKQKGKWWISEADVEKWGKEIEERRRLEKGTLSIAEAAKRLRKTNAAVSQMVTKPNKFPNAFKIGGSWRIPISDVDGLARTLEESSKKVDYAPKRAYEELISFIDSVDISKKLIETKVLYKQFCLLQINNMNGTSRYKRNRVRSLESLYKKLATTIKNEIYLVPSDDISSILGANSALRQHEKKILIVFLRHVYHQKNIEPDQEFSLVSTTENKNKQDMYSPELFHEIYQYTKDIDRHTPNALKDRCYVNMWVYTILLLTDFIRGQDLILNTPNIDLETVNIYSFDWFYENELSEYQSQTIINQLYTHFRYKRTSKTNELLTFIVSPDLIVSLATALIISELHRSIDESYLLLDSFLEGKFSNIKTQGKARHRSFFNEMKSTSEYKFSSLMMNRSVATYLFYSVTEEDGQDSDLALHLTQVSRSHKSPDTTSQYIQATNQDGSINRVSYNLFKRGHFGWLYNYLILYVSQFQGMQDTLEQRSNLIEQVRQEISPFELESVAKFVNNSLAPMPLKNQTDSMETLLENIYKKRQSVISKLKEYSKEEIREIITRLANGDLPSKNEHAQCLVFPNCKNPKLSNCFSCEYVIPGNLMLIQLKEELSRLVTNIEEATNDVILRRESRFLMHALFIWKEARLEFGDERVKAYIDIEKTWKRIEDVAHKVLMD
ncbi:helix-turn-helix domain-containing protein [Sporosarcina sp. resist]|uniref:helix-turn-helix domain-containing protein n=1 Tax=Sporosarcina sp. resist TaxID=2762563 RepID=UPI00164D5C31|nr:helix-turn-helix domain-containing protein [Sporosarcina sp. resist]QNK88106.1 helix-turn-helix domain-containing protein [Sporosarcina sp. resist]